MQNLNPKNKKRLTASWTGKTYTDLVLSDILWNQDLLNHIQLMNDWSEKLINMYHSQTVDYVVIEQGLTSILDHAQQLEVFWQSFFGYGKHFAADSTQTDMLIE